MTDQHGMTPSLRLAHVDGMLDYGREHGTIPLATLESARNHLAAVVNEHNALLAEVEQPQAERDGDTMDPTDVPDELVKAALKAYCVHCSLTVGRQPLSDHEEETRTILAAALPLHAKQIRAEHEPQHDEFGLRIDYVSTLREERPVADNLADAQIARDQIAARPDVVSCTVVRREAGDWHEDGDGRG